MTDHLPLEIKKILKEQNLKLVEVLQRPDTKRRRFFNLQVRYRAQGAASPDLVLKVFGRGDPSVVLGFEKEPEFLDLVTKLGSDCLKTHLPEFVKRGGGRWPWYLREYVRGKFLGDICLDFGIKKEVLTPALREEFLGLFNNLRDFSQKIYDTEFFSLLSPHGYDWYENDRSFYLQHIKTANQKDLDLIGDVLKKKKGLLDREARFLVHGDLYLKNMFWSPPVETAGNGGSICKDSISSGKLTVIDWELLHRGNLAFDIGFVWTLSFRDSAWREKLLSDFRACLSQGERAVFDELLPVVKTSLALRFIRHSEIMEEMISGRALANAKKARKAHLEALRETLGNQ